ncbi:Rieske [2Fe-2S] iron-sulfur domain-containing protein [Chytridium lagenaria]|nr:Rieske [2Fe-2S] iron-sulfur domain-containing protein [Chytridium lagenaria]
MTTQTQDELRTFFYTKTTDMRKSWYPILKPTEVVSGKVIGMHILDDPIVVYRDDETKQVVAFMDKCPHRSAPLSVGRIMDGKLECRYHGWQFNGDGAVIHIPSLPSTKSIPANAKVYKYPIYEDEFFVWIWPGRLEDSEKSKTFSIPPTSPSPTTPPSPPAPKKTAMTMDCIFTPSGTLHGTSSTPNRPTSPPVRFEFIPPCTVNMALPDFSEQTVYCVPTQKGHVRFFWIQRFTPLAFADYFFCDEMGVGLFAQEDYAMLVGQQKNLARGANAMNSPVAADIMIKTYRNWWRRAIKKNPYFQGYVFPPLFFHLFCCVVFFKGEIPVWWGGEGGAEWEESESETL